MYSQLLLTTKRVLLTFSTLSLTCLFLPSDYSFFLFYLSFSSHVSLCLLSFLYLLLSFFFSLPASFFLSISFTLLSSILIYMDTYIYHILSLLHNNSLHTLFPFLSLYPPYNLFAHRFINFIYCVRETPLFGSF